MNRLQQDGLLGLLQRALKLSMDGFLENSNQVCVDSILTEVNRDKGKEDQEHNFWSFIKGKKKQNHVQSTAASKRINGHDIKGKKNNIFVY